MTRNLLRTLSAVLCLLLSAAAAPGQKPSLAQQIATLLADPTVSRAHWGIMVTALDGKPLYSLNEAQFFQPASNAKLFTTAAAMALLDPKKTFETKVVAKGRIALSGDSPKTLEGDLVLVGGGDANLSDRIFPYGVAKDGTQRHEPEQPAPDALRYIAGLADQVAATGLKLINNDVIGDDTLFPYEPYPNDWAIDDTVWGYGAPVSALSVNDNQIKIAVRPGPVAGSAAIISFYPKVPYYTVEAGNVIGTVPQGESTQISVRRGLGSRMLRITGHISTDAQPYIEEIAVHDPAEYAAIALKSMLEDRGIVVKGKARANHAYGAYEGNFVEEYRKLPKRMEEPIVCLLNCSRPKFPILAEHTSPIIGEDIIVTNKNSQNLHAELLLHHLGNLEGEGGSTIQGARVVRQFLLNAGLDKDDFVFYDGSGLSGHDLVTPRATAKLLAYATTQLWFAAWRASLPIGGVDGSLVNRFKDAPLKGHVFAKTGTLGEARALSGYLDCASGRTVIFSIMDGNHMPGTSADRDIMDRIVAAIAAAN